MIKSLLSGILISFSLLVSSQSPGCGCPASGDCTISAESGTCTITGTVTGNLIIAKDNTVNFTSGASISGALTTTGENVILNFNGPGSIPVGNGLNIAKDVTVNVSSGATLDITGDITFTGNENSSLTVSGTLNASGGINCSPNCADHSLNTPGSGEVNLGGTCDTPGFCSGSNVTQSDPTLPVDLMDWNVTIENGSIVAKWATTSETNNDYFTIEESLDGNSYRPNKIVQGAGNSAGIIEYRTKISPLHDDADMLYYRLVQTDFDGKFECFSTIAIEYPSFSGNLISIFPNPIHTDYLNVTIESGDIENIEIVNLTGQTFKQIEPDSNLTSIDISDLRKGVYLLIASSKNGRSSIKFNVTR